MDYSKLTKEEKIELFNLRKVGNTLGNYIFKLEKKPGVVVYKNIIIGKKYKINNPNNRGVNGKTVEVICFVYEYGDDINSSDPIGVGVNFLFNNKRGTYYDVIHMKEI